MCIVELSNKSYRVGRALGTRAQRDMCRALMTCFGNARLDERGEITAADLPESAGMKGAMVFLQ